MVDFRLIASLFAPAFDRSGGGGRKSDRGAFRLSNHFSDVRRWKEAMYTNGDRFLDARRGRVDM
jgi:hypothetical protein